MRLPHLATLSYPIEHVLVHDYFIEERELIRLDQRALLGQEALSSFHHWKGWLVADLLALQATWLWSFLQKLRWLFLVLLQYLSFKSLIALGTNRLLSFLAEIDKRACWVISKAFHHHHVGRAPIPFIGTHLVLVHLVRVDLFWGSEQPLTLAFFTDPHIPTDVIAGISMRESLLFVLIVQIIVKAAQSLQERGNRLLLVHACSSLRLGT